MRFSIAVRTTTLTTTVACVELRAVSAIRVREIGFMAAAATAQSLGIGRPANVPAGGTLVAGQAHETGITSTSGLVLSGWTTAPTVPAQFMKRFNTAAIGGGILYQFEPDDLIVPTGGALVLWNITASIASDFWVTYDD